MGAFSMLDLEQQFSAKAETSGETRETQVGIKPAEVQPVERSAEADTVGEGDGSRAVPWFHQY